MIKVFFEVVDFITFKQLFDIGMEYLDLFAFDFGDNQILSISRHVKFHVTFSFILGGLV